MANTDFREGIIFTRIHAQVQIIFSHLFYKIQQSYKLPRMVLRGTHPKLLYRDTVGKHCTFTVRSTPGAGHFSTIQTKTQPKEQRSMEHHQAGTSRTHNALTILAKKRTEGCTDENLRCKKKIVVKERIVSYHEHHGVWLVRYMVRFCNFHQILLHQNFGRCLHTHPMNELRTGKKKATQKKLSMSLA